MDPFTTVLKLKGFPPEVKNVPALWTNEPKQGKISLLWNANYHNIYHKFSPFTNYEDNMLSVVLSDKQPFLYTYVDEADKSMFNSIPSGAKALAGAVGWNKDSINDVVRVSKFMISSWGVQFIGKQSVVQRLNAFDETRLYNPLSPVLATVQPLTLGIGSPPLRHVEGNTLLGLANSVTSTVGINLQSGFQKPNSTAGDETALPTTNIGQGKGMIRGTTATRGLTSFQSKWAPAQTSTGGLFGNALTNFASSIKDSFVSFFGEAKKSKGIFRADEAGYTIMTRGSSNLNQPWFGPFATQTSQPKASNKSTFGKIGSAANQITLTITNPSAAVAGIVGTSLSTTFLSTVGGTSNTYIRKKMLSFPDKFDYVPTSVGLSGPSIGGKSTGYTVTPDSKYSDVIGQVQDGEMTNSDMLVQFGYYASDQYKYPTKFSDAERATKLKDELQKVINKLNSVPIYTIVKSPTSYLLPSAGTDGTYVSYDNWSKKRQSAQNKGTIGEYQEGSGGSGFRPKSIDAFVRPNPSNLRMATTFLSDGINMLGVLPKNRSTQNADGTSDQLNKMYSNWSVWVPEEDDLIAFYFYDVVNEKYIPFRATIKAISEGNTAFWDELRFIGRADQLYSYNGFSRTLSFTFNVVVNSISELLPCWKKINYIASSVKPSNYTAGYLINGDTSNRFIIPPMFMLTIGDLYKYQPIVITSVNVNIPDDAVWETLNENNSHQGWSYLNGLISSPNLGKNYGQLPREIEIAVACNLLEKERAIVGGSHFGHGPRVDNWEKLDVNDPEIFLKGDQPYLPRITELHRKFIEWNKPSLPNPATPNSGVTQDRVNQTSTRTATSPVQPFTLLSTQQGLHPTQLPTTTGMMLGPTPISNVRVNNVAPIFNPGTTISHK